MHRTWCEVNPLALAANLQRFRSHLGPDVILAPTVKGGAYGHGCLIAAQAFLAGGADWLCVDSLVEARLLRAGGISAPIYVTGYVLLDDLAEAAALDLRVVTYNREAIERLIVLGCPARLHLKLETGNHRQGVEIDEALALAALIEEAPNLTLEGISSHFANVEDTTDHRYAQAQRQRFDEGVAALRAAGHAVPIRHLSNSAAALLWPELRYEMIRLGIATYGMWPSKETLVATVLGGRAPVALTSALTWKSRVAQVKWIPEGAYVGYGCSFKATHRTRLAIVPVGYYDGYDRGMSNVAHVLIRGRQAPVRGRICMNIIMVDVTHIPDVSLEDEVVLLGEQGGEVISAETMAGWAGTINYEIVTRIGDHIPRVACPSPCPEAPTPVYTGP